METHSLVRNRIMGKLGNGLVKLIIGPVGAGKSHFLKHDLFDELSKKEGFKVVELNPQLDEDPLPSLLGPKEDGAPHLVALADDVFAFPHLESLFDACAGRGDLDLIATSSFDPGLALGEEETLIRGRFEKFYFSPLSYADSLELGRVSDLDEYLLRGGLFISKEKCLEKTIGEWLGIRKLRGDYKGKMRALLDMALSHLDEPLSFERMMGFLPSNVSKPCLISYIDILKGAGLLLPLGRENLKKGVLNTHESVYYPGDVSFKSGKGNRAAEEKSLLLMKLFEESYRVNSGYVYGNFDGVYRTLEVAFVLRKGRDKAYLSFSDSDGAKESETMAKLLKDSFPKVVVVPYDVAPWRDENGIIHIGLCRVLVSEMADVLGGVS